MTAADISVYRKQRYGFRVAKTDLDAESTSRAPRTTARLAWLIGEWQFEDAQIEGDYRESGTGLER